MPRIKVYWLNQSMLVAQSCLTLCNPMDCSPLGSSVQACLVLQAWILEWAAISFSLNSCLKTQNWQIHQENPKGLQKFTLTSQHSFIAYTIHCLYSNVFGSASHFSLSPLTLSWGWDSLVLGNGERVKIKPHKQQPHATYFPSCNWISFN